MNTNEIIDRAFSADNPKAVGSITREQAEFICQVIFSRKPATVVEVGVASGRSSVVMSLCLARAEHGHLHCFDYSEQYYADPSLPVGYLLSEVLSRLELPYSTLHTGCTSYDAAAKLDKNSVDLVFIDANHQHPWPTLDTIALLPSLANDAVILHHDLRLFAEPQYRHGVGPKMLFDSTPKDRLVLPMGINPLGRVMFNMFGVRYTGDYRQYADELSDSLLMPQTIGKKIGDAVKNDIEEHINSNYEGTSLPGTWDAIKGKL